MLAFGLVFVSGLCLGAVFGLIVGFDRGVARTNREWLDAKNTPPPNYPNLD